MPLALAQRIDTDQMRPLRRERHGFQQAPDLMRIARMSEDRQAEGRLGDEEIAWHRLEGRAGRVAPSLEIPGDDGAHAAILHHHLRAAEDMPGGQQGDRDVADPSWLTVGSGLDPRRRGQAHTGPP